MVDEGQTVEEPCSEEVEVGAFGLDRDSVEVSRLDDDDSFGEGVAG